MMTYFFSQFARRPWREFGVAGAVAVGGALFVVLSAMGTGFRDAARAPLVGIAANVVVSHPAATADAAQATHAARGARLPFGMAPLEAGEIDTIAHTEGVAAVGRALQLWDFGPNSYVTVLGVDTGPTLSPFTGSVSMTQAVPGSTMPMPSGARVQPAPEAVGPLATLSKSIAKGRNFAPGERGVAVADLHYAAFFKLQPGDTTVIDEVPFRVIGIAELREGSQAAAANLYVHLADAQDLLGLRSDQVDQVYVRVANAGDVDRVVARLSTQLGNINVMTEDSLLQVMGGIGQVSARFAMIAAGVGLLGGLFLAWVALSGLVAERHKEIGVMKAVGWQSQHVERAFLLEAVVLSLMGAVSGFLLGWGMAVLLGHVPLPQTIAPADQTMQGMALVEAGTQLRNLPARLDQVAVILAVLVPFGGGTLAGWSSARRAAALKPADALRR